MLKGVSNVEYGVMNDESRSDENTPDYFEHKTTLRKTTKKKKNENKITYDDKCDSSTSSNFFREMQGSLSTTSDSINNKDYLSTPNSHRACLCKKNFQVDEKCDHHPELDPELNSHNRSQFQHETVSDGHYSNFFFTRQKEGNELKREETWDTSPSRLSLSSMDPISPGNDLYSKTEEGENQFTPQTHSFSLSESWRTPELEHIGEFAVPARCVVGPAYYFIGIIDMLQQWTWKKKIERIFKILFKQVDKRGISAIPPDQYTKRFQEKIQDIFGVEQQPPTPFSPHRDQQRQQTHFDFGWGVRSDTKNNETNMIETNTEELKSIHDRKEYDHFLNLV